MEDSQYHDSLLVTHHDSIGRWTGGECPPRGVHAQRGGDGVNVGGGSLEVVVCVCTCVHECNVKVDDSTSNDEKPIFTCDMSLNREKGESRPCMYTCIMYARHADI